MSQDNVLKVQSLWRAFEGNGLEAMLRIADDDVEWMPAGGGGRRFRGHDGLREFMAARDAAGDGDAKAFTFSDYGDCVLVYGSVRDPRIARGEERRVFWVYTFRDGKLIRFEAFEDHHEAVRAARSGGRRPASSAEI